MAADKDNTGARKEVREAAEELRRDMQSMTEESADEGKRTARAGGEAVEAAAGAMRETAQKGVEAVRSSTEQAAGAAQRVASDATDTARRLSEQSAEQFGRVFQLQARASEEMANRTSRNLDVMLQAGTVLADGYQSVIREWVNYTQTAVQRSIDGVNSIMRARTVEDLVTAQSDLIQEEMQLLLNSSGKISELAAKSANDAARRINQAGEELRRQA